MVSHQTIEPRTLTTSFLHGRVDMVHCKLKLVLTLCSLIRSLRTGVMADLIARTKFISFAQIVQCSMYFAELNETLTNMLEISYEHTTGL